jgi:hypothetical protein
MTMAIIQVVRCACDFRPESARLAFHAYLERPTLVEYFTTGIILATYCTDDRVGACIFHHSTHCRKLDHGGHHVRLAQPAGLLNF